MNKLRHTLYICQTEITDDSFTLHENPKMSRCYCYMAGHNDTLHVHSLRDPQEGGRKKLGVPASCMPTWNKLESFGKWKLQSRKVPLPPWPVGKQSLLLTDNSCGRVQVTVDSATAGLVGVGAVRKKAEQTMRSRPVSGTTLWLLLQLWPPGFCHVFLV